MLKRSTPVLLAACAITVLVALAGSSPAFASSAWWHLTVSSRPTVLAPEGKGEIVLTAANLGDAPADGEASAIAIKDKLPTGLKALAIEGLSGPGELEPHGPVKCLLGSLTCTFAGMVGAYEQIEVRIKVEARPGAESEEDVNEASVSGGQAAAASIARPVAIGEPVPFGLQAYEMAPEEEGGALATRAGSHPFQFTTTVALAQTASTRNEGHYEAHLIAPVKDIASKLPPGLIGDPTLLPRCTLAQFLKSHENIGNQCPPQSAVGVARVTFSEPLAIHLITPPVPIFNLEPSYGEPARFGFVLPVTPVLLDTSVRSGPGEDYGVTASATNISQAADLLKSELTLWGVPGDPRHDNQRGWGCLEAAIGKSKPTFPCSAPQQVNPPAFLTLPTSCTGPLQTSVQADSWPEPFNAISSGPSVPMQALDGCNQLHFSPTIQAEPTTDRASAPSGLDVNILFNDEGLTSGQGTAQSQLQNTVVTLPEGFTINPSSGVGLGGCSPAGYAKETVDSAPSAGCPNNSKLGTVEIETPLLTQKIQGSLFIAQPYENPFPEPEAGHPNGTLVAIYIVAKNPETGILIKLAGKVTPNPVTGQLTTTFDNNPQLPFDHFNFHFREGQQAPLISPPACGTYTTQAQLTPWSDPTALLTDTSSFTITKGYDGGACPSGGVPPFHPAIQSGTLNNNAGAFSPFYVDLSRTDGEQEISTFSTDLPSGLTGDLTGIPFCSEAAIALARTKTGAQEEVQPSCPASSQVGHTLVGTGVGAVLAYVPGKIYLAGPYNGDPFSLVSVTSAVVGPFDLGTVVIRFALRIDPNTAQVSVDPTASEPIPHIIRGIVTHVRDILVYIDRSNFILNPTSCNPLAISSTLSSNLGQSATISSRFQASNCAVLGFKPKFTASTSAKASRANGASLDTKISYPATAWGTQANIAKVKVKLPKQLPSRLTTLQKACTDTVFNINPAACPAASRVGTATTTTPILPVALNGPVYFVSHGIAKFPELIIILQGYGVTVELHGETFISKAGITSTTFNTVPDVPVGSFELKLPLGRYSALAANGNLCKQKLLMPTRITAQNGAVISQSTKIAVSGCAKAKKKAKSKPKKKK